jgi:hypothetical protein
MINAPIIRYHNGVPVGGGVAYDNSRYMRCTHCGAEPGAWCVNPNGTFYVPRQTHEARFRFHAWMMQEIATSPNVYPIMAMLRHLRLAGPPLDLAEQIVLARHLLDPVDGEHPMREQVVS